MKVQCLPVFGRDPRRGELLATCGKDKCPYPGCEPRDGQGCVIFSIFSESLQNRPVSIQITVNLERRCRDAQEETNYVLEIKSIFRRLGTFLFSATLIVKFGRIQKPSGCIR